MAYYRMPAYQLLFSETEVACGKHCGKTIELEMKVMSSARKVNIKILYLSGKFCLTHNQVLCLEAKNQNAWSDENLLSFLRVSLCGETFLCSA